MIGFALFGRTPVGLLHVRTLELPKTNLMTALHLRCKVPYVGRFSLRMQENCRPCPESVSSGTPVIGSAKWSLPVMPSSSQSAPLRPAPSISAPSFRTENIGDVWDITPVTESVYWRLLLMSDGQMEGFLLAMLGNLRLGLIESILIPHRPSPGWGPTWDPQLTREMPLPWRRRCVQLMDAEDNVLIHATSWWDAELYNKVLGTDESKSTWQALNDLEFRVARRVLGVEYGPCPSELRNVFGCGSESVWCRHMLLKRDQKPMAFICEILSPALEECLGPMTKPTENYADLLAQNIENAMN